MVGHLKGHVIEKSDDAIIVDVHGLGYEVFVLRGMFEKVKIGEKLELYIHHHIREDASKLYGFEASNQKQLFRKLISVSGIGPKSALAVLSSVPLEELIKAIQLEDHLVFQSVSGIGPKTAKRVVIELKTSVDSFEISVEGALSSQSSARQDVISALEQLGYTGTEINSLISGMDLSEITIEEAIKSILSQVNR